MVKKYSDKELTKWECPEGCDVSRRICEHLEQMLPKIDNSWVYKNSTTKETARVILMDDIETRILEGVAQPTPGGDEEQFTLMLEQYDISELERELLLQRFYYNMTYKLLAEEFNFVGGASSAHKAVKAALRKLEKQGFSL